MSPWWVQYKQGWKDRIPPPLRIAEPSLKSELAIWAQKVVAAKARLRLYGVEFAVMKFVYKRGYRVKQDLPRSQQEFAVLEFVYKHKYRVKEYLPRNQQQFAVLEFVYKHEYRVKEYLPRNQQQFAVLEFVTKQEYKVENVDLVDDVDWDIQGPTQDTKGQQFDGEDDDDEWLKVDELYTPSVLEGICVLTANPDSVGVAGRALTPDGRVINLNGGGPVAFSCEAENSSGHIHKVAAITMAKASSDARLAKAASDVDTESVCSIDTAGTVRGGAALDAAAARTNRLKLFHRKRKHCQGGTMSFKATRHSQVLSVDVSGRLFVFNVKKCVKSHRKARVEVSNTPKTVMTIDAISVVRDVKEHWDVRRGMDIDPDVLLIIDANGVIRTHDDPFAGL